MAVLVNFYLNEYKENAVGMHAVFFSKKRKITIQFFFNFKAITADGHRKTIKVGKIITRKCDRDTFQNS